MQTQTLNVLITGANRGIGLSFAKLYAQRENFAVYGTCRNIEEAEDLKSIGQKINVLKCDISDDKSVDELSQKLQQLNVQKIDLLINNAGYFQKSIGSFEDESFENFLYTLNINTIGPFRIIRALLPSLRQSANPKIINISSKMGSIALNTTGSFYAYRASKAGLNAIIKSLSIDLKIPILALHPGLISTRMRNFEGEMTPDETVDKMVKIIDNLQPEMSGKFLNFDGQELVW